MEVLIMAFVEKQLWLATNFASKMIKETGYRNKSIKIAANYYKVKIEDVEKELNKRISKGAKKSKRLPMKTWYFKGTVIYESEAWGPQEGENEFGPFKATTRENAMKRLNKEFESRYGVYPPYSDSYYTTWYVGIKNPSIDLKEVD